MIRGGFIEGEYTIKDDGVDHIKMKDPIKWLRKIQINTEITNFQTNKINCDHLFPYLNSLNLVSYYILFSKINL